MMIYASDSDEPKAPKAKRSKVQEDELEQR